LLRELVRIDPALEVHPKIDRELICSRPADSTGDTIAMLASARRRAYFEWGEAQYRDVTDDPAALGLAQGRYFKSFRDIPLLSDDDAEELCRKLCSGISRLERLPPQALDRMQGVPLRITPRTPTESAFWVERPFGQFQLKSDLPSSLHDVDVLHRQVLLIYRYKDGREECLHLGAELFHLLLELSEGYQLGDVSTDDTFAHLSIFVKRLIQEDDREMFAWNPIKDRRIFAIHAKVVATDIGPQQKMIISSVSVDSQE